MEWPLESRTSAGSQGPPCGTRRTSSCSPTPRLHFHNLACSSTPWRGYGTKKDSVNLPCRSKEVSFLKVTKVANFFSRQGQAEKEATCFFCKVVLGVRVFLCEQAEGSVQAKILSSLLHSHCFGYIYFQFGESCVCVYFPWCLMIY